MVEITEKLDGSQYRFWKDVTQEKVFCHGTKRTQLQVVDGGVSDKLFNPVVRHMEEHGHKVPPNVDFLFGETLHAPKHNTLKYNVVPKGHLALWGGFDASHDHWLTHDELRALAHDLCVDVVPLVSNYDNSGLPLCLSDLDALLERESFLGGAKIEGLVFKNYSQDNQIGDEYIPFLAGKFVSEKFKEQHVKNWSPKGNAVQEFIDSFQTEARWLKSIQHLREEGILEMTPRDIGLLMKDLHKDIEEEEKDTVQEWFYNHYIKQIKRRAGQGLPEFYKRWLVENSES
jgi:hypothetical protein